LDLADAFECHSLRLGESRRRASENEQATDRDRNGTQRFQIQKSPAHRGAGVNDIIDHDDPFTAHAGAQRPGYSVSNREQSIDRSLRDLFSNDEPSIERFSNHEGHECPFDHWSAHNIERVLGQFIAQAFNDGPEAAWPLAEPMNLEPQVTMMARLIPKVALARIQDLKELIVHQS
jgi:hypothetical protein